MLRCDVVSVRAYFVVLFTMVVHTMVAFSFVVVVFTCTYPVHVNLCMTEWLGECLCAIFGEVCCDPNHKVHSHAAVYVYVSDKNNEQIRQHNTQ